MMKKIYFLLLLVFCGVNAWSQTTTRFNDGYLTLYKVTSGAALNNTGTAIVTEEYLPVGAAQASPNFSVSLPTTTGAPNKRTVIQGTSTNAGQMTRSENGRLLTIPGYDNNVGDAAATFLTGAMRTIDGTGTVGAGIQGTFHTTGGSNLRSAITDDGTNFWTAGSGVGTLYSNNGSTVVTVSTTSTNMRSINIFNGQLYFGTGAGSQGVYSVGTGKPITSGQTSTRLFTPTSTGVNQFSLSPDGKTLYYVSDAAPAGIYRSTFDGVNWTAGTLIFSGTGYTGVTADWTAYVFSTTGANAARIYACNPTTLVGAADNGTSVVTATTLRTLSGNNAFRGISFSPIKQTVSLGTNSPAAGNITQGVTDAVLFQFNLAANEGNSTIKKVIVNQAGTATIGANNDISNFRLIDDANNNGVFDGGEATLSTGTVAGANITFSAITLASYITEAANRNFLIVGDVAAGATAGNTFIPAIIADKSLNSVNYTTNLVNAGGSWVTIGATAPTGNTLTITAGATPAISLTPTSLTGFKYIAGAGPSAVQSFAVTGANLTPAAGNIVVTAPADYEINDGLGWTSASFNIPYTGGTLSSTNVDVRLKAGLAPGFYNSELIDVTGGGDTKSETVSGKVVAAEPTIQSAITFGTITNTSIVVNFGGGNGAKRILLARQGSAVNSDPLDEITYTDNPIFGLGTQIGVGNYVVYAGTGNTVTVTGLAIGTNYHFAVYEYNDGNVAGAENYLVPGGINDATTTAIPVIYTWIGGSSTWNTAANWLPARLFPASNDILLFLDGTTETVTNVPNESIGQLHVTLGTHVTLQAAATGTALTLNGSILLDDLTVDATSSLNIDGANSYSINLASGTTCLINGAMTFTGTGAGGTSAHKLTAADPNGIIFSNGSVFTAGTGFLGNAFGTANLLSVIFQSGSRYDYIAGSNPFGAPQPNSVVVFQTGNLFRALGASPTPAFSGRNYADFEFAGSGTATLTGGSAVTMDNLTITSGVVNFNMTGTPGHSIKGNIIVATGATLNFAPASAGTLNLNGAAPQGITNSGTLTFSANQNVNINNAAGITLNSPVTLLGTLTFTSGIVNTSIPNLLTMGAGSSVAGASNASYVFGPVKKTGNTAFIFPVGKANGYVPIGVSNFAGTSAPTDQFTAEYIRSSAAALGPETDPFLTRVSACEYWTLDVNNGTPTVDLTLYWNANNTCGGGPYITSLPDLEIAHFDGVNWSSSSTGFSFKNGTPLVGDITWPSVSTFSPFTLASTSGANPLPITINYFTGTKNNGRHLLDWKVTCISTPSATLEVERSTDGRTYNSIYSIFATALRCQQPFDYTDNQPEKGVNYYRLKMTDVDGKVTYSSIVSLINGTKGIDIMNIAPNPIVGGRFNLRMSSAAALQASLLISDMQGRILKQQTLKVAAGFNVLPVNVQNLATGSYQAIVTTADGDKKLLRFVVQ